MDYSSGIIARQILSFRRMFFLSMRVFFRFLEHVRSCKFSLPAFHRDGVHSVYEWANRMIFLFVQGKTVETKWLSSSARCEDNSSTQKVAMVLSWDRGGRLGLHSEMCCAGYCARDCCAVHRGLE